MWSMSPEYVFDARTSSMNNKDRGNLFQVFMDTTSFLGRNAKLLFELTAGLFVDYWRLNEDD